MGIHLNAMLMTTLPLISAGWSDGCCLHLSLPYFLVDGGPSPSI